VKEYFRRVERAAKRQEAREKERLKRRAQAARGARTADQEAPEEEALPPG
jgi:hypothetical protein